MKASVRLRTGELSVLVIVTLLVGDFAFPQALPPRQGRVTRERKLKSKNEKLKYLNFFCFFPSTGFLSFFLFFFLPP